MIARIPAASAPLTKIFTVINENASRQRSRSILLYNTAIAYEKAGDAIKSVQYYELYLREMPDAKEQEEIQRKMPGLRLYAEAAGILGLWGLLE